MKGETCSACKGEGLCQDCNGKGHVDGRRCGACLGDRDCEKCDGTGKSKR